MRESAVLWDSGWVRARRTTGARSGMATEWACRREMKAPRVGRRGTVRRRRTGGNRGGIFLGTVRAPYSNTRRSGTYSVAFYPAGGIGRRSIGSFVGGETLELDIKMFFGGLARHGGAAALPGNRYNPHV